jgi:hypothetical protein
MCQWLLFNYGAVGWLLVAKLTQPSLSFTSPHTCTRFARSTETVRDRTVHLASVRKRELDFSGPGREHRRIRLPSLEPSRSPPKPSTVLEQSSR